MEQLRDGTNMFLTVPTGEEELTTIPSTTGAPLNSRALASELTQMRLTPAFRNLTRGMV